MDTDLRKAYTDFAAKFGLSLEEFLRLRRVYSSPEIKIVLQLLLMPNPDMFQRHCRRLVRYWVKEEQAVKPPLSQTHLMCLIPNYPILWEIDL